MIIYPDNRVVLDYGEMRDLVLIALIDTETGADIDPAGLAWPGPRAETVSFTDFGALLDQHRLGRRIGLRGLCGPIRGRRRPAPHPLQVEVPRLCGRPPRGLRAHLHTRVWEAAAVSAAARMGMSAKAMAARLRLSPETVTGLLGQGEDPVEGLRNTLPEEFLPWYDAAVAEVTAKANERIRLYESLAREATMDADDSDRAFAAAAQRLAADNDVHPGPIFASPQGASRCAPRHLGPHQAQRSRRACDSQQPRGCLTCLPSRSR